jgi:NTP pyrophosphatase (non-canonical NTP hydrolase)
MKLTKLVDRLCNCPNFTLPPVHHAFVFLMSEVGEAADALSSTWTGYIRSEEHSPTVYPDLSKIITTGKEEHNTLCQPEAREKVARELADVVIMASIAMAALGVNPDVALQKKLTELVERFS